MLSYGFMISKTLRLQLKKAYQKEIIERTIFVDYFKHISHDVVGTFTSFNRLLSTLVFKKIVKVIKDAIKNVKLKHV